MTLRTTPSGLTYDLTITPCGELTDEMRQALWEAAMIMIGPQERTAEHAAWLDSLTPDQYADAMLAQEETL